MVTRVVGILYRAHHVFVTTEAINAGNTFGVDSMIKRMR
jgi:hypothetical protein